MIEAYEHPPLRASLIRRQPAIMLAEDYQDVGAPSTVADDLRFFAGAYAGALLFFLVWLS